MFSYVFSSLVSVFFAPPRSNSSPSICSSLRVSYPYQDVFSKVSKGRFPAGPPLLNATWVVVQRGFVNAMAISRNAKLLVAGIGQACEGTSLGMWGDVSQSVHPFRCKSNRRGWPMSCSLISTCLVNYGCADIGTYESAHNNTPPCKSALTLPLVLTSMLADAHRALVAGVGIARTKAWALGTGWKGSQRPPDTQNRTDGGMSALERKTYNKEPSPSSSHQQ
eukprot:1196191-Prorocentrum_minimum.AAC.4